MIRKITNSFIVFVFSLLTVANVLAAPIVENISGVVSNGEMITISGSNFGIKPTAAPLISSYDNNVVTDNWSNGEIGDSWYQQYDGQQWLNNVRHVRTPFYQSSYNIEYDAADDYSVIGYSHNLAENKLYISFYQYMDYDQFHQVTGSGDNAKFIRIWDSHNGGSGPLLSNTANPDGTFRKTYIQSEWAPDCPDWSIDYTATNAELSGLNYFRMNFGDANYINTMQEWVHWELYFTYSDNLESSEDSAVIVKNGQTVARVSGISLTHLDELNDARLLRIGQVTGGRTETQMEYVDQIYYDNSFAHVFISDSSTLSFSDMTDFNIEEVQVASSWNDVSITVSVNQGVLMGDVFLYVMDDLGEINNNGFPVTIGEIISYKCNDGLDNDFDGLTDYPNDLGCASSTDNNEINEIEIYADVNQDSQINTTDAMLTFRNSLGLDMTGTAWVATDTTGDVNCDGNSNSVDAMLLLRYSLGLSMSGTEWCE